LSDFVFVWWGLLFEAMPFVILGAILSGLVERCVSRETVVRFFTSNRFLGIAVSACLGLVFPMCECGVVPVVRRLVRKGVPVSCGITYMLAAPIVNPLVMLSTFVAFSGSQGWTYAAAVAALRTAMGAVVAITVGLAVWRILGEQNALLPESGDDAAHTHEARRGVLGDILRHAADDFLVIGSTLVVGAGLAALINSAFSREAMAPFADNPFTAVTSMLALAVALNLCSEADAFVGASFFAFPIAAKLAFLVLGPMLDLKLIAMYTTVFRKRTILLVGGLTTLLVFLLCTTGYLWIPRVMTFVAGS
ncbi:MAG: permease, partial [Thermoguttaceae bacterium]